MHNLFNFSSFNIALNEIRNVSAHAFRPNLACDLISDGGWGWNLPRSDLSSLSVGFNGIGKSSFSHNSDSVRLPCIACSPRRTLGGCVRENCQEAINEKILRRFELISPAGNTFSPQRGRCEFVSSEAVSSYPVGSRFSILSSHLKPSSLVVSSPPAPKNFLPKFCESFASGEEGWSCVVRRRRSCTSLERFCIASGRCFKCSLLGHKKALCRFNGLCFCCKSPDHAVPICKFVS